MRIVLRTSGCTHSLLLTSLTYCFALCWPDGWLAVWLLLVTHAQQRAQLVEPWSRERLREHVGDIIQALDLLDLHCPGSHFILEPQLADVHVTHTARAVSLRRACRTAAVR
eukprot:15158782-Heterocapsa_arctica.AAC.1